MKKPGYIAPQTEHSLFVQQTCLAESVTGTGENLGDSYNMDNDDFTFIF